MPVVIPAEWQGKLPTDDDIRFFREHGWWISPEIFTHDEIDAAVEAADRFYRGEFDHPAPEGKAWHGWTEADGDRLRKNDHASLRMDGLRALSHSALLGAVAARLAGVPAIRLWHDQLLWKPVEKPGQPSNVGWHTDYGYWKTCSSPKMLTAWAPFHDCGDEEGTITMIDGSHLWPDNTQALDFFSNDLEGLEAKFDTGGAEVVKIPCQLKKGQVSFHHCLTIHGSGPNHSQRPRRSLAIHLQDDANEWKEHRWADGALAGHDNDHMVRKIDGHPDYRDPRICPQLWP
jgi:hypothetical protein